MFDFLDKPAFSVLGLSVVAYTLYYAITAIYLIFFHLLAKFSDPKLWTASCILWVRYVIQNDICNIMEDLHEKYRPNEITTISPTAWNDIYISKPMLPKDPYSQIPSLNGAHSLFTVAGDEHKRIQNMLIYAFSDKALRDQAPIIENYKARHRKVSVIHFMALNKKTNIRGFSVSSSIQNLVLFKRSKKRLSKGNLDNVRSNFITLVIKNINKSKIKDITKGELIMNGLVFAITDYQLIIVFLSIHSIS
ncbi:hypothetical protein EAF00_006128 [Botryotinia globosa]|nr:hypothetical protein EAF00_006128 [Botryotinia globosa]